MASPLFTSLMSSVGASRGTRGSGIISWNPEVVLGPCIAAFKPAALATAAPMQAKLPSIRFVPTGPTSGVITPSRADWKAAGALRFGAGPHEIRPVNAQALDTPYGPKAKVNHPGHAPVAAFSEATMTFRAEYIAAAKAAFAMRGG